MQQPLRPPASSPPDGAAAPDPNGLPNGTRVRWQAGQRGHVESYFLKLNSPAQRFAAWFKFTFLAPLHGEPLAEVWAVWFDMDDPSRTRAWKASVPLTGGVIVNDDIHLRIAGCELTPDGTRGSLSVQRDGAAHTDHIDWDLRFTPGAAPLVHLPWAWMYERKLPKSKILAPHPASRFDGSIHLNGERFTVHDAPGTLGHNWGAEHAWSYAWAHCSAFDGFGEDTFFEGFSTRIKLGCWVTPVLSVAHLSLDGHRHAFNRRRSMVSRPVSIGLQRWQFRLDGDDHALVGEFDAPRDDFICLHYGNPDGSTAYCLNSKLASGELRLLDHRDRVVARLTTARQAALEVLTRSADHGVRFGA
ncbi:hypothetical protein [Aquabacterium sp.]|uniref:hypothetical protein n=1 Tax=Aquabacterium sp. TaxID=1872578 RepID=UPI0035B3D590